MYPLKRGTGFLSSRALGALLPFPHPQGYVHTHREMTSEGRFLGTALESTQKAVSLVQEQLGGQGGVLGGFLALACSIRQKPNVDSTSSLRPGPSLARSPAMPPTGSPLHHRPACAPLLPAGCSAPLGSFHLRAAAALGDPHSRRLLFLLTSGAGCSPFSSEALRRTGTATTGCRGWWTRTAARAAGARAGAERGGPGRAPAGEQPKDGVVAPVRSVPYQATSLCV